MTSRGKPRVLHVITGLRVGGSERALQRLVAHSSTCRHSVVTLAEVGEIGKQMVAGGTPVASLGAASLAEFPLVLARLSFELRRDPPDVVQSWLVHANLAAALVAPRQSRLVWNIRQSLAGLDRERITTRAAVKGGAMMAHRADAIIYNSRRSFADHRAIGYPAQRSVVIANGFDVDAAAIGICRREATRGELGIGESEFAIGLISRVHPIKNHSGFIEACLRVRRDHPGIRVVLVGAGTEPEGTLAHRYAGALGPAALWLGERPDAVEVTAALDLACNVSFGEAFSNTVGEAMACAVPCLVTDVGDSATIVGGTGWVIADTSSGAIADGVQGVLRTCARERAIRGAAARERIISHYSIERSVAQYESLYQSLSAGEPCTLNAETDGNRPCAA